LKRSKKTPTRASHTRTSKRRTGTRSSAPRTAAQYHALPERSKDTLERALKVISKVRSERVSPRKASKEVGISFETVKRWVGSALKKLGNGRFTVKPSDQAIRNLRVPSERGPQDLPVRGFKQATLLSNYWHAVGLYVDTGDASGLDKFRGKSVKSADGVEFPLITDLAELRRQGNAGVLSFNSMYSRTT
jgi:hypothetical protein